MKKIGFLISFILITLGSIYFFALPPLLEIIIKAEITRKNVNIEKIGGIDIYLNKIVAHNLVLNKGSFNIDVEAINIISSPITLLIKKKAKALEIISTNVYIDLEQDRTSNQQTAITDLFKYPHQNIAALLDTAIIALGRLSPSITFKGIKIDSYTQQGLISVSGDCHINKAQILGSFSSVQKQLTFNAQLTGHLDKGVELTGYIDNINLDIENYKIKRGAGKLVYKARQNNKKSHQSFTANIGLLKLRGLSLNNAEIKSESQESTHKTYIKAQHSPKETQSIEYWHNIVEGQTSAFLQARKILPQQIFDTYLTKENSDKLSNYKNLIAKMFLHPSDITIQTITNSKGHTNHNISILPELDYALAKLTLEKHLSGTTSVNISPTQLNATQVKALAHHFLKANIYNFSGAAELSGHFLIDLTSPIIKPNLSHHHPLTLHLKNGSFKSDTASAKGLNGNLKLLQDGKAQSTVSFDSLSTHDLRLRNGRFSYSLFPSKTAPLYLSNMRATLGTGTLTILNTNDKGAKLNGRRVNASSLPSVFHPEKTKLYDLIDINGMVYTASDNVMSAKLDYEVLSTSLKTNKTIKAISTNHEAYPYIQYLGGQP